MFMLKYVAGDGCCSKLVVRAPSQWTEPALQHQRSSRVCLSDCCPDLGHAHTRANRCTNPQISNIASPHLAGLATEVSSVKHPAHSQTDHQQQQECRGTTF